MTARFGLVGHPIDGSPSPRMHDAAFAALGLDARYELRPTRLEQVEEVRQELSQGLWAGLNVTTPLKTTLAASYALEPLAARAGAINTLWRDEARWMGALTDVDGVAWPLRERGLGAGRGDLDRQSVLSARGGGGAGPNAPTGAAAQSSSRGGGAPSTASPPADEALVLGAGGAARAAVLALEALGLRVSVASRRLEAARAVVSLLDPVHAGRPLDLAALAEEELSGALRVLVQATPVGRAGESHALRWASAPRGCVAFEMVYRPRATPFVEAARRAGLEAIEGWEMLVAQGAAAFERWSGHAAPREVMRHAVLDGL